MAVMGTSVKAAVFMARKVTMALLAVSLFGFSSCRCVMALSPSGVALLPRPSMLAARFMIMALMAG